MNDELIKKLEEIISKAVDSLGYELWGIEFSGSERGGILRIYIDSPSGISISDCTEVSKHLDVLLDVEDPIAGSYIMEVSSPGLERKFFSIKQLEKYIGKEMSMKLKIPIEERKKWRGCLRHVNIPNNELTFEIDGEEKIFQWQHIESIKLLYWKS
jgi:ribosome maturation factor RimP